MFFKYYLNIIYNILNILLYCILISQCAKYCMGLHIFYEKITILPKP